MKKGVFIIPYFGKFNNYFQLFLNSCKMNEDWDWLIFTDDKTTYVYPDNVIVYYTNFEKIREIAQSKFDFQISLDNPYKLCDYKPTYGYLFEEYISKYKYWGHCDCDLIFGNLNSFLTEDILGCYDKIFCLGHCTLYRNKKENNEYFKETIHGIPIYKKVLSQTHPFAFDEEYLENNINWIFREHNHSLYEKDFSANINRKSSDLRVVKYDEKSRNYVGEKEQIGVFLWNHGRIEQYYVEEEILKCREFLYIHLQNRKMNMEIDDLSKNVYKISANNFRNLEVPEITIDNYCDIKWKYRNNQRKDIFISDIKFWINKIYKKIF